MDAEQYYGSRLPPSSSALIALASLTPPSPILSPSQLPATLTSGDIPFLLDFPTMYPSCSRAMQTLDNGMAEPGIPNNGLTAFDAVDAFEPTGKASEYQINAPRSSSSLRYNLCAQIFSEVEITDAPPSLSPWSGKPDDYYGIQKNPGSVLNYVPCGDTTLNTILSGSVDEKPQASTGHSPITTSKPYLETHAQQIVVASAHAKLESVICGPVSPSPQVKNHSQNTPMLTNVIVQAPLPLPKAILPRHLDWLRDTTVELLIDQEGFRSIRARFKFSGYSKQTCDACDDEVQFRPVTRQVFYFHYAPFDGLPILRRIMTNGEESRDYISRQASLSLKSNGVYTVRGSEMPFNSRIQRVTDIARLNWRFDYLVGDRYDFPGNAGKRFDSGEKLLTPLTFSCSPYLLHLQQGKRVKLIHVVKKSVVMKLVAEKMEPPTLALPVLENVYTQLPINSWEWTTHRRAKSHSPRHESNKEKIASFPNQQSPSINKGCTNSRFSSQVASHTLTRHRRASSAGEWNAANSSAPIPPAPGAFPVHHPSEHSILCGKLLDTGAKNNTRK